jgi:predicted PurR-regulated permease PerM
MPETTAIQRSQVSVKTVLTICLTVLLVAGITAFVVATRVALTVTVAAALVATALHHAVDALKRHRVPRGWALAITIVLFLIVIAGVLLVLLPTTINQVSQFVTQAPEVIRKVQQTPIFQDLDERFHLKDRLSAESLSTLEQGAAPALRALGGLVFFVAEILSGLFLVLFMLVFGERLVQAVLAETIPERRDRYHIVGLKIYRAVGGYIAGLSFIGLLNATLTAIFLAIMRVPYFLPLALLSGISELVPYGGPIAAAVLITLLALITKGLWIGVAVFIYFLCYGQLEGQILSPLIYGKSVHVNPLITFLSILFMAEVAGVMGAVVEVPAAAAVQIITKELLAIRRERLRIQ